MTRTLDEMIAELPPARRRRIEARAAKLIAELRLREIRKQLKLTQVNVAKALGVDQGAVCRIEQRAPADMKVGTIKGYIEALGGKLLLVAKFPDRDAVPLSAAAGTSAKRVAPRRGTGARRRST